MTKYVPAVGYFLAAGWWLWVFLRPVEKFGFKESGMGPAKIREKLGRYRKHVEETLRKLRGQDR